MEQYINDLLSQLTLEEKVSMIHGAGLFRTAAVERLGIPPLYFSDGPMGVRGEYFDAEWRYLELTDDYVTYLPCNSAVASTWNRELARQTGAVLGEEARGRGKDVILAPGINIKRTPLCGRNFEYMSEDPYLVSQMAVPMVQGIQTHDVAACVKHFAANAQETNRLWVDTLVDTQTLQEVYFPGFRAAVCEGGALTLMGAYNLLNGEHCCTSKSLLNQVLRQQWGFDGLVVSDWGGVHDTALAGESSLDVEMDVSSDFDGYYLAQPLLQKVREGAIPEAKIDEKVRNILRLMLRLKMIGPNKAERKPGAYNTQAHREAVKQCAEESVILLKNEEHILPISPEKVKTVAVIGPNAVIQHAFGGGSAEIRALYEITPLLGIKKLLGGNVRVSYAPGCGVPKQGSRPEISWQATSTQEVQRPEEPVLTEANLEEAVALARESDAVIYIGGLNHDYDTEGLDRRDMKLPYDQDAVIEALLDARPDTVVVLYAGSPVEMPWLSRVKSLVWSYYAGMEGGAALADVLFGRVNPSGKLAETFLKNADQCPGKISHDRVEFLEGSAVGYRWYDRMETDVNFCFGHGLTYTSFAYSDLDIQGREASFTLTNTGDRAGSEAAQLYVEGETMHQLRRFEKIHLQPGQSRRIAFALTDEDFSRFDCERNAFAVVPGRYCIEIGASSRDIRLKTEIEILP